MIIFSEIGDKTFLITAVLAMRHSRLTIFLGAITSLAIMSWFSACLGHILPHIVDRKWTQLAAAVLFWVFGIKMLLEAWYMGGGEVRDEMREAAAEINEVEDGTEMDELERGVNADEISGLDEGKKGNVRSSATSRTQRGGVLEGIHNFCSFVFGPAFVSSFVLTFLGEWGDRSQISTIALGAAHPLILVTVGTVLGHVCCTSLAVIGGRWAASHISPRGVTLGGACLFIVFGVVYLHEAYHHFTIGNIDLVEVQVGHDSDSKMDAPR
ncbi:vacuole protein [Fistulina hepatica ATCC 64428]|uniref:GDT1 family protein n=1 Tax=Fistulina hepatica ATCC 64428 TaxID=1128425 RepID=A0A0D7AA21_9AGAR|nr:vacuole protein [Fistulina hepatica ATCC 64428]